jgi:hypothetical protein
MAVRFNTASSRQAQLADRHRRNLNIERRALLGLNKAKKGGLLIHEFVEPFYILRTRLFFENMPSRICAAARELLEVNCGDVTERFKS